MKRPVAESAATDAAVNEPHARPSHTLRDTSGEVSSGSRVLTFAAVAAAVVVLPDRFTAGGGGAAGFGGAGGAGATRGAARTARWPAGGTGGAGVVGGFVSSAIGYPTAFNVSSAASRTLRLVSFRLSAFTGSDNADSFNAAIARRPIIIPSPTGSMSSSVCCWRVTVRRT